LNLKKNDNAECLAEEIADPFKDQPYTDATDSSTVQGTEPQFPSHPILFAQVDSEEVIYQLAVTVNSSFESD
jgi:hypothetical protein